MQVSRYSSGLGPLLLYKLHLEKPWCWRVVRLYELHHLSPGCYCVGGGYPGAAWLCCMRLCYGYIMVMFCLLLRLDTSARSKAVLCPPCQPGGINVSAVPRAPQVSVQPLSSCLAYPGFRGQCNSMIYVTSKTML